MIKIIGGGLAGLSLGVYLRKLGVPVTLYETGKYPKHKVCGEFICGVQEVVLREMGLANIIDDSEHHREMSWWMGEDKVLQRETPMVAWGLSRYKLDEDLAGKFVELGGVLELGQRVEQGAFSEEGCVYGVGKKKSTGAGAWIGLKVHLQNIPEEWMSGLEMHVGKGGYIGLCGIEEQRVNVCGLFKVQKEVKGRGSDLLLNYLRAVGLRELAERLQARERDEASFSATAGFALGKQEGGEGFSLGDSGYLIPPFTGNGMSMAIESAYLAGQRILSYTEGLVSWEDCIQGYKKDCEALFKKRMGLSMKIHPLLFTNFGRFSLKASAQCGVLPVNTLFKHLRTP